MELLQTKPTSVSVNVICLESETSSAVVQKNDILLHLISDHMSLSSMGKESRNCKSLSRTCEEFVEPLLHGRDCDKLPALDPFLMIDSS